MPAVDSGHRRCDPGGDGTRTAAPQREAIALQRLHNAESVTGYAGVRFFVYEADGVRRRNVLFRGGARLWSDV